MPAMKSNPERVVGDQLVLIVIVTFNSADALPGLLDSLKAALSGVERFRVLVVDNASADDSVEIAAGHSIGVTVIPMGRNAGYSAAINAAAAAGGPDSDLLILNPDTRLHEGSVRQMQERLSQAGIGVIAPRILDEDGTLAFSARREPSIATAWSEAILGGQLASFVGLGEIIIRGPVYERGGSIAWATGAALLISAEARRAVGDWDESYFLYSEEVDYLRRVRQAGLVAFYEKDAVATHIGGESNSNPKLYALLTANRIRYYRRYHGPWASALFHVGVALGEAIRFGWGATHRAGLRAAVMMPAASIGP